MADRIGTKWKEMDRSFNFVFVTTEQVIGGIRCALGEADELTRRIESALGELGSREPRDVANRFSTLIPECRAAADRSLLSATFLAQVDACSMFHNILAVEGKASRDVPSGRSGPGGLQNNYGEDSPGAPLPGPASHSRPNQRKSSISALV